MLSTSYYGNLTKSILFAKTEEEKEKYYEQILHTSDGKYTNAWDKFILENPHERTIQIICGILFLPVIVLTYLLIKENFNYKTPFVFFIIIYVLLYKTFCSYYIKRKKGMEIIRSKPLIFNSQKISSFISWMIYPILVVLLYFIITHRHWLKIIQ